MPDFSVLEELINFKFNNQDLLKQVFIHRSYLNEHRGEGLEHNERLEFLGDAVLELVVTEFLYLNYNEPEGVLTNWRSSLVKGETLAQIAIQLEFSDLLLLSKGEMKNGGQNKNYLLANAFEALVGALYLDQGFEACTKLISDFVISRLPEILETGSYLDPKSQLQEYTQEHRGITPNYRVLNEEGPDHAKQFLVGVYLGEELIAKGNGSSKQSAQVSAASEALKALLPNG